MDAILVILFVFLVVLVFVTIGVAMLASTVFSSAPWVATEKGIAKTMCELAGIGPDDMVIDLGCGDANMLVVAAKEFGAKAYGVELNPLLVQMARFKAWRHGVSDKVTVVRGNMFTADLPDKVDVAMLYLLPKATHKVEDRLRAAYPNLRVVSHGFQLKEEPVEERMHGRSTVRLYRW